MVSAKGLLQNKVAVKFTLPGYIADLTNHPQYYCGKT